MPRFTDNDKWKDVWFRNLKPREKLLWIYIVDNCDNAGFFEFDPPLCAFMTGMEETHILGAIKGLSRGLVESKESHLFYVKNFLKHQRNIPINPENNAHKQILRLVAEKKDKFADPSKTFKGLLKPPCKGKVRSSKGSSNYTPEFEEWWKTYMVGNKANAMVEWERVEDRPANHELIALTAKYRKFCSESNRKLKDGERFLKYSMWETEWTHEAQGTSAKDLYRSEPERVQL